MSEGPPSSASEAPASPPVCPKCGRARLGAPTACARCGLVFERFQPEASAPLVQLDDAAEALWQAALERWADEAKHEAFIKHCAGTGLLGPAGQRYRGWLDGHPGDALAQRMQARIVSLATVRLGVAVAVAQEAKRPVTRSRWFWAILFVGAGIGVALGLVLGGGAGR